MCMHVYVHKNGIVDTRKAWFGRSGVEAGKVTRIKKA